MGNCVEDKPNKADCSLNLESVLSCNNSKGFDEEVERGNMEISEKSDFEATVSSEIIAEEDNNTYGDCFERIVNQDEMYDKEKKFMGEEKEEDSEHENTSRSNKENIGETRKSKKIVTKSGGSKKKSKGQLKEERMKIHSETHRLMREREIAIPYHVPKQRTLKEFLARKKNRANIPLNMPSSKMLEIWKDIEESTKNAFEFFKSDSESDSESCIKNEQIADKEIETNSGEVKIITNDSDMSNRNNEIVNSNSTDNVDNECEILAEKKTKSSDNLIANCDDNAIFICEDSVRKLNELDTVKVLVNDVQKDETGDANDGFTTGDETSDLVVDIINSQNKISKIDNTEEQDENYVKQRTSDWVKKIQVYEKHVKRNKKEMLLQKLNPKLLNITPMLSGEPDSFIDLENDKKSIEIGAKNLKKRFIENCIAPRNKAKTEVELTITTSEKIDNGEIKVATDKLIYNSTETLKDPGLEKPGAKLQRLREELKRKIEAKWEEENRKKMEELQIEAENKKALESEEEEEELIEDDQMEESDDTEESEPEEDDVPLVENKKKKNCYISYEAEESECEEEESGDEGGDELDDDDEDDGTKDSHEPDEDSQSIPKVLDGFPSNEYSDSQSSLIPPYQPGGGMLNGGSPLTQNDEDISLPKNVLSPALRLSLDFSPSSKNANSQWGIDLESPEETNTKSNFVPCFPENKNFDLNDAYEFCSGKFPDEGSESRDILENSGKFAMTPGVSESQLNCTDLSELTVKETIADNEEKDSGKKKRTRLKVASDVSDDEIDRQLDEMNGLEDITGGRLSSDSSSEKSLPVRNKGKRKNLVFSDEEDDPEAEKQASDESDEEEEVEEEEEEEEEEQEQENSSQNGEGEDPFNEEEAREVMYDSEEAEVNVGEYFEDEAELSGSEWSRDEDERDLDEFELEDGDQDKLDEKKVRSELEKIHMRTLLDDDAREVRLLQELLFEDGDLFDDGPKRERNFRWKDLGTFFDDDQNDGDDQGKCQEEVEEDEEARKIRHEKELFLLQMKSKREELEIDDDENEKSLLKGGRVILKRSLMNTAAANMTSKAANNENDDLNFKTPFALANNRGSFLSRNEEFLSRLAKFTSAATDNILGPKNSKNFVFAAKNPDEGESSKENSHPKRKNTSVKGGDEVQSKKVKLDITPSAPTVSILDRLT